MSVECPVCRRTVASRPSGSVRRHNDKAGNVCPMSARHLPKHER